MTFTYRYRKQLVIGVIILILSVILGIFIFKNSFTKEKVEKESLTLLSKKEEKEESKKEEVDVYYQVDIKGEVINPGIYSVKEGSRVIDVIRLAGDLTYNASTKVLNLAKKVEDEMVIIVYSKDEVLNFTKVKEEEKMEQEKCQEEDENAISNDACITSSVIEKEVLVNINSATLEELMTLTGIGEAKAEAIIKYREENGSFTNIEDIKNISGIGESLFAKIKENITI